MSLPKDTKRKIFDGRYEILSIVGRGADSVVYHARHTTGPATEVAIKVLVNRDNSTTLTDKLRKEALTLVSCRHKYVVRLDDFHSIKDLCYLSMEYAPLGDLSRYISTTLSKLPADQAETFLRQSLEALDFIHATGVIHRDLKPENILVVSENQIRLADFGLALLPGDELALEELRKGVGTFEYLAPEVLDGIRYDTQSDLYSLGVCFYEAVTGAHPFRDAPLAQQREIRQDAQVQPLHELAPELPDHLSAVIASLMRFSADDRFASASEALKALGDKNFKGLANRSSATPAPSSAQANATEPLPSIMLSSSGNAARVEVASPPTAPIDIHTPANTDVTSPRAVQPTEKIDLERVKAIIARDSQRKPSKPQPEAPGADTARDPSDDADARAALTPELGRPKQITTSHSTSAFSSGSLIGSLWSIFSGLPTIVRLVGVALLSALLTIGVLLTWHTLTKKGTTKQAVVAARVEKSDVAETSSPAAPSDEAEKVDLASLAELPAGIYTGALRGLLPGGDIPMAIISRPADGGIVLALGIEGWVPTLALTSTDGTDGDTLTFRSNGLILRFNRELSSAEITGTVVDVVTGDTGVWKIAKSS